MFHCSSSSAARLRPVCAVCLVGSTNAFVVNHTGVGEASRCAMKWRTTGRWCYGQPMRQLIIQLNSIKLCFAEHRSNSSYSNGVLEVVAFFTLSSNSRDVTFESEMCFGIQKRETRQYNVSDCWCTRKWLVMKLSTNLFPKFRTRFQCWFILLFIQFCGYYGWDDNDL